MVVNKKIFDTNSSFFSFIKRKFPSIYWSQKRSFSIIISEKYNYKKKYKINNIRSNIIKLNKKNLEEEIDLFSHSGALVMVFGATIFYLMFKIDQEKNNGYDHKVKNVFNHVFGLDKTLSYYSNLQEKYGSPRLHSEKMGFFLVTSEHLKNYFSFRGNWESLYSKYFRLVNKSPRDLLPPLRENETLRTLVIDLDTIIHSAWSREMGYERCLRKYWKTFLQRMVQSGWEIIIFSNDEQVEWEDNPKHIEMIDDRGYVSGILWGGNTCYFNGHKCKDVRSLRRQVNRLVFLDSNPKNVQLNPQNAVLINPWSDENSENNDLEDVTLFLEYLQKADIKDVRTSIEDYRGLHISSTFKEAYLDMLKVKRENNLEEKFNFQSKNLRY